MKKILFFALLLVILGVVSVSAQVRIGGDETPNAAAVLDLNADDDATPTGNKGALALPRISLDALSGEDANLNGTTPIAGMLVYNTNTTLGKGIYFWDDSKWVAIGGDGIVVDAVTDATDGRGLVREGSGTITDPYTLGIAPQGVDTSMMKRLSYNDAILVHTSTGWRIATYGSILNTIVSGAANAVVQTPTPSATSCRGKVSYTTASISGSMPIITSDNMGTYIRSWSQNGGSWHVMAQCWLLR